VLDQQLQALQDSAFAYWVQSTAYPWVISLHSIGLAVLVGLLVVIDLRVLGLARGLPLAALNRLMTVVWVGFSVNAISGAMLFTIDARKDFYSSLFRLKLSAIAVGLIAAVIIKALLSEANSDTVPEQAPGRAKLLAVVSLVSWAGAIVAGRLMAYFTFSDVGVEY
jgi:hypothetical protein